MASPIDRLKVRRIQGSKNRTCPGRPRTEPELESLIVRMAQENRSWGYDRMVGALANLGYKISDNTIGNILKRNGLAPAPERKKTTTWREFIRTHRDLLFGTDFFSVEVWTLRGLVTFYVLFFIRVESREIHIAGITPHPNESWMAQIGRNMTMEGFGFLKSGDFLIHDRDRKFCWSFQRIIESAGTRRIALPPRSPDLNAFAERWVRSIKEDCLSKVILFGESSLRRTIIEYVEHYHRERNHQGKDNVLLFPSPGLNQKEADPIQCRERVGGLLKYYHRKAA